MSNNAPMKIRYNGRMKSPKIEIWDVRWEKGIAQWKSYLNRWLTVDAKTEEDLRRGRLLAGFITIMLALSLVITLYDLQLWRLTSSATARNHLLIDVLSLAIIAALFASNKNGYFTLTAHLALLFAVLGGSLLYAVNNSNFALIYFAFPIMMASFTLKPYWSIMYAVFSTLGYGIAHLSPDFPIPFNVEGVLVFFALAVVSFLSASRLEEAVKNAEQSGVQYRNLVERIPAIIYTAALDEAKTRLYVSPQVERILGFTQEEYLANSELWRELLHPDDRQRILGEAEYFYTTGEPFISEYRTFTRDGRVVWIHDEAVILHNSAGKPQWIQGVRMDITELKQAEEKIKTPLAQLASLRAIDVAIMSTHDLRMIFYILLSQTIAKLEVDAARILLFNSSTRMLEFGAAQGFLTADIEKTYVKLGEEISGRAAIEGRLIDGHRLTKEFFST
ncbi:MAG TPA: PAS domain-containing protein, partial [Anaerolineales bacterium]|nr:PAS domain-containing protein [Anaerolineales bacterium]